MTGDQAKEILSYHKILVDRDTSGLDKKLEYQAIDMAIKALEYEPTNTIDYRRAFKIACELLNGTRLYGVDADKIFEIMMNKDGIVTNDSYEEYILNHLQELDQGQYASSSGNPNKSEIPTSSESEE
jgi:hypothetical protein